MKNDEHVGSVLMISRRVVRDVVLPGGQEAHVGVPAAGHADQYLALVHVPLAAGVRGRVDVTCRVLRVDGEVDTFPVHRGCHQMEMGVIQTG